MTESKVDTTGSEEANGTEKVKVVHFEVILEYPEYMDNEDILDSFANKILDEAALITSDDVEIKTKLDVERLKSIRFDKTDLKNLIYSVAIQIFQPLEAIGKYKGNSHHLAQEISEKLADVMTVKNAAKLTD